MIAPNASAGRRGRTRASPDSASGRPSRSPDSTAAPGTQTQRAPGDVILVAMGKQLQEALERGECDRARGILYTLHRELGGTAVADGTAPGEPVVLPEAWEPYPIHVLPAWAHRYVLDAAQANAVDPSWIGLSLLVSTAALIGRARVVELGNGHQEPSVLWGACAGSSGSRKSAAVRAGTVGFAGVSSHLRRANERRIAKWRTANALRNKSEKTRPPPELRVEIDDVTVERVVDVLRQNPRGLLLLRDELGGFLAGIGEYKRGSLADAARWCSTYDAGRIQVDRKQDGYQAFVPAAAVSILGGIQPATLGALYGERGSEKDHVELGLVPRLMFAMPPEVEREPPRDRVPPEGRDRLREGCRRLWTEVKMRADAKNRQRPVRVHLTPEAEDLYWDYWLEQERARREEPDPCLAAVQSKATGLALRLALVVAYLDGAPLRLDTVDVEHGIALARWHAREARRVAFLFRGDRASRLAAKVLEVVERRCRAADSPDGVTCREVGQLVRGVKNAAEAERILSSLVAAGRLAAVDAPTTVQGGRPTVRYRPPDGNAPEVS